MNDPQEAITPLKSDDTSSGDGELPMIQSLSIDTQWPPRQEHGWQDHSVPSLDTRWEIEDMRYQLGLVSARNWVQVDLGGRYELRERVGRGAMGAVYRAFDHSIEREVAIKVVSASNGDQAHLRKRLLEEAKIMRNLVHENVLQVLDVGTTISSEPVIVLEYIPGVNLRSWQRGRTRDEIVDAYLQAARGLAAVHRRFVVHRDFKPTNILVEETGGDDDSYRVLVADFGLAVGLARDVSSGDGSDEYAQTISNDAGTPAYMAPEQHEGRPADERSDQYAFCVSLWEALVGQPPFPERRTREHKLPVALKIPRWLRRLLEKGLSWYPEDRYRSMGQIVDLIERRRRVKYWAPRAGGFSATSALAAAGLFVAFQEDPCANELKEIDQVWSDSTRDGVRAALGSELAEYAIAQMDGVAEAWRGSVKETCEREQTEQQPPQRTRSEQRCHRDWLARMSATATLLQSGDEKIIPRMTELLGAVAEQGDTCNLRELPAVVDSAVFELAEEASRAEILDQYERVYELSAAAVEAAKGHRVECDGSGYSNEEALAYYWRGRSLMLLNRWDEARENLTLASRHASVCRDTLTSFDVGRTQAELYALGLRQSLLAEEALHYASAELERMSRPGQANLRRVEFLRVQGLVAGRPPEPDYVRAVDNLLEARELVSQLPSASVEKALDIAENLFTTYYESDQPELAKAEYERVLELTQSLPPAAQRREQKIDINYGMTLIELGEYERGRSVLEATPATGAPTALALRHTGLIQASLRLEEIERAHEYAESAQAWLASWQEEKSASKIPEASVADLEAQLGRALTAASREELLGEAERANALADGLDFLSRSARRRDELGDPLNAGHARLSIGRALAGDGQCEHALAVFEEIQVPELEQGVAKLVEYCKGQLEQ